MLGFRLILKYDLYMISDYWNTYISSIFSQLSSTSVSQSLVGSVQFSSLGCIHEYVAIDSDYILMSNFRTVT